MSLKYAEFLGYIQTYKVELVVGGLALYAYLQNPTGYNWLAHQVWESKHNPVNTIFPKNVDTSDVNKLPVQ